MNSKISTGSFNFEWIIIPSPPEFIYFSALSIVSFIPRPAIKLSSLAITRKSLVDLVSIPTFNFFEKISGSSMPAPTVPPKLFLLGNILSSIITAETP